MASLHLVVIVSGMGVSPVGFQTNTLSTIDVLSIRALGTKLQWNVNWKKIATEHVCEISAILFSHQCVKVKFKLVSNCTGVGLIQHNQFPLVSLKLSSSEYHKTSLLISQHRVRWWLGAVRKQAIFWSKIDQSLCCHMVSLGHNELT